MSFCAPIHIPAEPCTLIKRARWRYILKGAVREFCIEDWSDADGVIFFRVTSKTLAVLPRNGEGSTGAILAQLRRYFD